MKAEVLAKKWIDRLLDVGRRSPAQGPPTPDPLPSPRSGSWGGVAAAAGTNPLRL